jgi:hypothetical protein
MKAHVLFDNEGRVGVISHQRNGKMGASEKHGGFLPGAGQHAALLDIPAELAHLKPRELHESVRVEKKGGTPRLVARAK